MTKPLRFLVIDENPDSRFLLVKTLLRKFPAALLQECHDCDTAVATARTDSLSAVVAHRTYDCDGIALVRLLRDANPRVPIVMVSGIDRTHAAIAAGANAFLNYDEWLRIGTVVTTVMGNVATEATPASVKSAPASAEPVSPE